VKSSRLTTQRVLGAGSVIGQGARAAYREVAELEEALIFLAPRLPGLRLDGDPSFGTIQGIYGLESLPIAWGG